MLRSASIATHALSSRPSPTLRTAKQRNPTTALQTIPGISPSILGLRTLLYARSPSRQLALSQSAELSPQCPSAGVQPRFRQFLASQPPAVNASLRRRPPSPQHAVRTAIRLVFVCLPSPAQSSPSTRKKKKPPSRAPCSSPIPHLTAPADSPPHHLPTRFDTLRACAVTHVVAASPPHPAPAVRCRPPCQCGRLGAARPLD